MGMICHNCQQETEEGKFCTNCGAALNVSETSATTDTTTVQSTQQQNQAQNEEPNEYAEKIKEVGSNFGEYFMTLLKRPSEGIKFGKAELISSIITMVIYSLIISLNIYVSASRGDHLFGSASFGDDFLVPLIKYIILFGLIALITFGASKLAGQKVDIQDVIAKYGALLLPFMLLYIVGIILSFLKLNFGITTIALLGPVIMIPILIVKQNAIKGFDEVYLLLGMIVVTYIAYYSLRTTPISMLSSLPW